jgi:hypothetical protein
MGLKVHIHEIFYLVFVKTAAEIIRFWQQNETCKNTPPPLTLLTKRQGMYEINKWM